MKSCCFIFAICVVSLSSVLCQDAQSPCPDKFKYSKKKPPYGYLSFTLRELLDEVEVVTKFSIPGSGDDIGRLQFLNDKIVRLKSGEIRRKLKYKIRLPDVKFLPVLTLLEVDGEVRCRGTPYKSPEYTGIESVTRRDTYIHDPATDTDVFDDEAPPVRKRPTKKKKPTTPATVEYGDLDEPTEDDSSKDDDEEPVTKRPKKKKKKPTTPTSLDYGDLDTPNSEEDGVRDESEGSYEDTNIGDVENDELEAGSESTKEPPLVLHTEPPQRPTPPPGPECGVIAIEGVELVFRGYKYDRGEWPWLVALYRRKKKGDLSYSCSGTLVSAMHVITAAHCMKRRTETFANSDVIIRIGVFNLQEWGDGSVIRSITATHFYKDYNPQKNLNHDILVLTLNNKVDFTRFIRPACLWLGATPLERIVGKNGIISGWGLSEEEDAGEGEPKAVRIPIVSTDTCRASKQEFHDLTSNTTLCAGDQKGSGPCVGDSGSGLFILENSHWQLRGIVSLSLKPVNADTPCNLNEYQVFTDVAQYLPWIKAIMEI